MVVSLSGLFARLLCVQGDDSVDVGIDGVDTVKMGINQFDNRHVTIADQGNLTDSTFPDQIIRLAHGISQMLKKDGFSCRRQQGYAQTADQLRQRPATGLPRPFRVRAPSSKKSCQPLSRRYWKRAHWGKWLDPY